MNERTRALETVQASLRDAEDLLVRMRLSISCHSEQRWADPNNAPLAFSAVLPCVGLPCRQRRMTDDIRNQTSIADGLRALNEQLQAKVADVDATKQLLSSSVHRTQRHQPLPRAGHELLEPLSDSVRPWPVPLARASHSHADEGARTDRATPL